MQAQAAESSGYAGKFRCFLERRDRISGIQLSEHDAFLASRLYSLADSAPVTALWYFAI
jgi:hypothetical protein